ALLSAAIVAVLFAGLDNLPREVRNQIHSESVAWAAAQKQLNDSKAEVGRERSGNPELFAAIPSARAYDERLARGGGMLQSAGTDLDALSRIEKRNRRTDRDQAANLLRHERQVRESATAEIETVRKD